MGKKIYFPDKVINLEKREIEGTLTDVESKVAQRSRAYSTCFIQAPLYGLLKHNPKAFKKLITDDPEHNRVTVHLFYKGKPYDIEMDRTRIFDSKTDFTECSPDVNLIIKALMISNLAKPDDITDMIYEVGKADKGYTAHVSAEKYSGGNPIEIMAAFSGNMVTSADKGYQKSLSEKAEKSINDISDDLLAKLDEWSKADDRIVTLSVFTTVNHAVTLTGVDRDKKTITYYDQMFEQSHTIPLETLLDNKNPNRDVPRLDQILSFQVGKDDCQTKGYETIGLTTVRQAIKNKAQAKTENDVTERLLTRFSNMFNEAWKDYAKDHPDEMKSILKDVLASNHLSWEKWNNRYSLEKMLDAEKNEFAYQEEYRDKKTIFDGIRKHLQNNPETRRSPQELGIIDDEKIKYLNEAIDRISKLPEESPMPEDDKLYNGLFGVFKAFGLKKPNAENAEEQFPKNERNPRTFLLQARLAVKWKDEFLKAFDKDRTLTVEAFNETETGKELWAEYTSTLETNSWLRNTRKKDIAFEQQDLRDRKSAMLEAQNEKLLQKLDNSRENVEYWEKAMNNTLQMNTDSMKKEITEILEKADGFLRTENVKMSSDATRNVYAALRTLKEFKETKLDKNIQITHDEYINYYKTFNKLRTASESYETYKKDRFHKFGNGEKRYTAAKELNAYMRNKKVIAPGELIEHAKLDAAKKKMTELHEKIAENSRQLNETKNSLRRKTDFKSLKNEINRNRVSDKKKDVRTKKTDSGIKRTKSLDF